MRSNHLLLYCGSILYIIVIIEIVCNAIAFVVEKKVIIRTEHEIVVLRMPSDMQHLNNIPNNIQNTTLDNNQPTNQPTNQTNKQTNKQTSEELLNTFFPKSIDSRVLKFSF
jgi:hypothetical protein